MQTITNSFHQSSVHLRPAQDGYLSQGQCQRARRILCGIQGCLCGGDLGERGKQQIEIITSRDRHGDLSATVRPLR